MLPFEVKYNSSSVLLPSNSTNEFLSYIADHALIGDYALELKLLQLFLNHSKQLPPQSDHGQYTLEHLANKTAHDIFPLLDSYITLSAIERDDILSLAKAASLIGCRPVIGQRHEFISDSHLTEAEFTEGLHVSQSEIGLSTIQPSFATFIPPTLDLEDENQDLIWLHGYTLEDDVMMKPLWTPVLTVGTENENIAKAMVELLYKAVVSTLNLSEQDTLLSSMQKLPTAVLKSKLSFEQVRT